MARSFYRLAGVALLASASAAALLLAAPPYDLWPLGFVAWVPLLVLASELTPTRAAWAGWLLGAMAQSSALRSVFHALHGIGGSGSAFSLACCVLLALFEGGRSALLAFASARALRNGWPPILAFPPILLGLELAYPLIFPWYTALFVHSVPLLMQTAELAGPLTVSAWMALLNASLASAWIQKQDRRAGAIYGLVVPALVLVAVSAYGAIRLRAIDARVRLAPRALLGLVQGNISALTETRDPAAVYRAASLELLGRERPELLIWPEAAIFYPVDSARLADFFQHNVFIEPHARRGSPQIDVPVLTGLVVEQSASAGRRFNSAVLAHPSGSIARYDKRTLLTLGESIPLERWFPSLHRLVPNSAAFSRGNSTAALDVHGKKVLTVICYEDILYSPFRSAVLDAQPDLMVNLTNDGWFGHSAIPSLHLALAAFRAVEHRRFLVRASNDGLSALIDPAGRIAAALPAHEARSAVVSARWMQACTPFEIVGDVPWYLVALLGLRLTLRARRDVKTA